MTTAAPARASLAQPLTVNEEKVLTLLSDGMTYREVADHLGISMRTVVRHTENAGKKIPGDMVLRLRVTRWFCGKSTWLDKQ